MTDQTPEQVSAQTPEQTTDRAAEREVHATLVRRIEATITARPALGELMYGLLEHLDRVDDSEENCAMLLAMLDFARRHPDLALIMALLGRCE